MEINSQETDIVVPFEKFAKEVEREFKLKGVTPFKVFAYIDGSATMVNHWIDRGMMNHLVSVCFELRYGKQGKFMSFSHMYKLDEIADEIDDFGVVEEPGKLPVHSKRLSVNKKFSENSYNFGKPFDGDKFVKKMFKECERSSFSYKNVSAEKTLATSGGTGK